MKKQLLVFVAALWFCNYSNAQVLLTESFEGTFPPTGWVMVNNGAGNAWTQNTDPSYSSDGTNSMEYAYSSTQPADAWAFTPAITLNSGDIVNITFDEKVASANYPENLKLTVGSAQTVVSQTTILYDSVNLKNTSFRQGAATYTAATTGTYYFAFNCHSATNMYNLFVDNIKMNIPLAKDAGVTMISAPSSGCSLSASEAITVKIKNFGSDSIYSFPVSYSIDGATPVTETVTDTIVPFATLNYSFTTPADLSATATFNIKAYTALTGDNDPTNDSITKIVDHVISGGLVKSSTAIFSIPDNTPAGISSPIIFCGLPTALNGTSLKIDYIRIDSLLHTWDSDLDIYLISPNNDSVEVSTGNGGSGDNIIGAMFGDYSTTNVSTITDGGIQPGYYHVEAPLGLAKLYNGQDPNGIWKLLVSDHSALDVGTLYGWSMAFTVTTNVAESNADNSLVAYPNPTDGNLNVIFKGESKELNVKMMNVAGQLIYNEALEHFSGNYSSLIDMSTQAKGVYFLQITSDNQVTTKKIVRY